MGQLFLSEPVVAVSGQPFVLREESPPQTIGGGRVLQPTARRVRRHDDTAINRISRLRSDDPSIRASAALAGFGLIGWTERSLCREAGVSLGEVASVMDFLTRSGSLVTLPIGQKRSVRVPAEVVEALEDRTLRALGRLHALHPRQSTIPRTHVAAELPDLENDALVGGLIDRLKSQGKVSGGRAFGRAIRVRAETQPGRA